MDIFLLNNKKWIVKSNFIYSIKNQKCINKFGKIKYNIKRKENKMTVSKEELLHIANLADIKIKDEEIDKYLNNLQDILNYTELLNSVDLKNLDETIGANDSSDVFRKDEIIDFDNKEGIMENSPEKERNMFKIPKVLN